MNIVKSFVIFFVVMVSQLHSAAKSSVPSPQTSCSQVATIIFSQHLAKADIPKASKAQLQQILNNLYLGYLVRQNGSEVFTRSGTDQTTIDSYWQALKNGTANYDTNPFCMYTALKQSPQEIQASKICIDTASLQSQPVSIPNCQQNLKNMYEACASYQLILQGLLAQLDAKNFQSIAGDDGQYQTNYATFHLSKAVARLAATSSMISNGMTCTPKFTGDVRDRGIIVNIQNNTQKDFAIVQSTLDGTVAKQIGMLKPGLNNVNLHLAALQASNATPTTPSAYKFDVVATDDNLSDGNEFSIKIMSGTELLTFLKSINKNPKGLFYMNGRLIAPKYAVDPKGQFLVLIKVSKNQTVESMAYDAHADQDFPVNQRVQVVALDNVNPYFITMQINEDDVEYKATKDAKEKSKATILQPSFFSIQPIPGLAFPSPQVNAKSSVAASKATNSLSPVILPDFLGNNVNLNIYTTMLQTAYIAALTDFAFFNQKCFTDDMMCYNLLGYFDKKNQRRFILNFYPLFITKKELHDIKSIIESAVFQTNTNTYSDIPSLYIYIDGDKKLISNEVDYVFLNLEIKLNNFKNINSLIENKSFSSLYGIPLRDSLFIKLPEKKIKEDIFVYVYPKKMQGYEFIFKDKDDVMLEKYVVNPSKLIEKMEIDFLNGNKNWVGAEVPNELISLQSNKFYKFKINCTIDIVKQDAHLYVSKLTAIDKIEIVHTINFSEYPIKELYLDLYNTYEVSTIYRCNVIENGILPTFLQSLSQNDWMNGIYMITDIKNNHLSNKQQPGVLRVIFYQSDGITKLGQIILQGKSEVTGQLGITEPMHAYNIGGKSFGKYYDIFLSTGILLKFNEKK